MVFLRRYLALAALFFWQGGFTFYAAVVVPVGQVVLKSHLHQGFVTRRVTFFLNLSGAAASTVLAWDLFGTGDLSRCRRWTRIGLWGVMVGILGVLFVLHARLDSLLDPEAIDITDRRVFRHAHRLYLWISTAQWAAALAYLALTLRAWRAEDRGEEPDGPATTAAKKSAEEAAIPR
jgi:Na+-driven multidrug efflux pump